MALFTTPDGRRLEVETAGPVGAPVLLYHHGQPGSSTPYAVLAQLCADRGLRLVSYSRPGYGDSTRRPDVGRAWQVADDVADAECVLDAVGATGFVTLGWSGGGPRAIACAALLPDRCAGAVSLAGVAPHSTDGRSPGMGENWFVAMAEDNVRDYRASLEGEASLRPFLEEQAEQMCAVTAEEVAEALVGLLPPVDVAVLSGDLAEWLARQLRGAVRRGPDGFVDDALVTMRPWGLDLAAVQVPVAVWQGTEDLMVPPGHGRWLAEHVAGASDHLLTGEGHLSLLRQLPAMVDFLADTLDRFEARGPTAGTR
ncbi:MAG: alpha/beta fold hydrolase [Nostocoides sp.]